MLKFIVICILLSMACAKRIDFGHASVSYSQSSSRSVPAFSNDNQAQVLSAASNVRSDGFDYHSVTSNGASSKASGDEHGRIHGGFGWISPEGQHVSLTYVADENGYRPESSILPTPPPIPEAILKSLRYNEQHPHEEDTHEHHHYQHSDQHQQHHEHQHYFGHHQQHHRYHHHNLRF